MARFWFYWRYFGRRDSDAVVFRDQIDELKRLYPEWADEIHLKEYKRLGKRAGHYLENEAKRIIKRTQQFQQHLPIWGETQKATMVPQPLRFSRADYNDALRTWGCDCGFVALAAVLGISLNDVRQLIPEFSRALTYAQMQIGLDRASRRWNENGTERPSPGSYGLVGINYNNGRLKGHWVAAWNGGNGVKVLDNHSLCWMDGCRWDSKIKPRLTDGADYEIERVIEVECR